jgi:hypothetical protein
VVAKTKVRSKKSVAKAVKVAKKAKRHAKAKLKKQIVRINTLKARGIAAAKVYMKKFDEESRH